MGGKNKKANPSYNYFGTVAGLICRGPIDRISAIIVDGKVVWEGNDARPASPVSPPTALNSQFDDFTTRLDAKWFAKQGSSIIGHLRVYWGTDDQVADPGLSGHPAYKGWAYLVGWKFLFGREKTTAPNIEVVCTRKPVASTDLVASIDNTLEDGQANPVAILAELLTSPIGAGLLPAQLDGASWQAAAAYCRTVPTLTYCSPLLANTSDLRSVCAGLLAMFDGALAWTPSGTLAVRLLKPGVDPGGLTVLDAPIFTVVPRLSSGSWGDIATKVVCRHVDRARKYKETDASAANLVAARMRSGEQATRTVDLPHVTRPEQALRWATELIRRSQQPGVTVDVSCRAERVVGLTPGSKVLVDVDPEPGGSGLAQLAVIEDRKDKGNVATLRLVCDPLTSATPYAPTYESTDPEASPVDPIAHALLVALGPAQGGPAVAVLATRPQSDVVGYEAFFVWDTDGDGSLGDETPADLGRGIGFSCRLDLVSGISDSATTADLHLTDPTGPDTYLADLAPNSTLGAEADELVIVLANVDGGTGRVVVTDGQPEIEVLSVIGRTPAVPDDTHTYQVLRARLGWPARAWTTSCQAWLLPADNLLGWTHPAMSELLRTGAVGTMRLAAVTASEEAETLTERTFQFPASADLAPRVTWVSPSGSQGVTDGSGNISLSITILDWDGDLTSFEIYALLANGDSWHIEPSMLMSPSRTFSWSKTVKFAAQGVHKVVVKAKDKRGIETTTERTVVYVTGGTLVPPTFTPVGADNLKPGITSVTIAGSSPATKMQYSLVPVGVGAPAGAGTEVATLSQALSVQVPKRVWARTGDGSGNWSAWVSADYTSATAGGGGGTADDWWVEQYNRFRRL